ncbi:MAG: glycoside hydrolase family 9 protein [Bacteroidetes bacterium]|nr:glycoside hydrolase family 9 protein [Bacteroidota bacterium]
MKIPAIVVTCLIFIPPLIAHPQVSIFVNEVAYNTNNPKTAIVRTGEQLPSITFDIVDATTGEPAFRGISGAVQKINEWDSGKYFYQLQFPSFDKPGKFTIAITVNNKRYQSEPFVIGENALAASTIPSVIHYYYRQRANTREELAADTALLLYGSTKTVDLHGGWCDASGDVSKYFSHLAYANFMSPQQIPLVTWSLINAAEKIPSLLEKCNVKDSIKNEALWGSDYIMRSLSKEGYFYMTVFSYFNKDPKARRVVGLQANSVTTSDYQCAFREGGGMAIAALARISQWHMNGDFTSAQYLDAAQHAFIHLLSYNKKYDDDGKENIIDDYCALMAATELWIATGNDLYKIEARKRAGNLSVRMMLQGYFIADGSHRPFWHASDAGLPVIALARYLAKETDSSQRKNAIETIRKALEYNLRVTNNVSNPFGYARQTFEFRNKIENGFFIPHENETGWWWQGENARLASLATAAIVGGRLVFGDKEHQATYDSLRMFASQQLSWILGCNPYAICFMYGFGKKNVPYMHSNYGHGSELGGISNGITGNKNNADGSGIDFRTEDHGNEWRWTEQWIPHAAWFLQAITALSE